MLAKGMSLVMTLTQRCHPAESLADLLLRALTDPVDRLMAMNTSNTQAYLLNRQHDTW